MLKINDKEIKNVDDLKEMGLLTRGLDNMIAGIEDKHESHVYLLKQRCMNSF